MTFLTRQNGVLYFENVALPSIAERFGTPTYVYSRAAIETAYREYANAFADTPHMIFYSVKANSNLAVLSLLAKLGSGFDIVSIGELHRVLAAGGSADRVVFSGVGKTIAEIKAAMGFGIRCFNVESETELERIESIAASLHAKVKISMRVNPDVDPKTHPYISTGLKENKFGIAYADAFALYQRAAALPHIEVVGIDMHIGSQIFELSPFVEAAQKLLDLVDRLAAVGIVIKHLDLGGGIGIRYQDEAPLALTNYAQAIKKLIQGRDLELMFEPGRRIVGNAGLLLMKVELLKPGIDKNFAVVDAAMNDLIRPTLYGAWMDVVPVNARDAGTKEWDVVGPICESGDWLAKSRHLAIVEGDLLAVTSAGAYGMSMASNYNTRPRAAEVMVDGDAAFAVRPRETVASLFDSEVAWFK